MNGPNLRFGGVFLYEHNKKPLFSCTPQQRREEHERHIREQEEELLQQELELQERQQRQAEEEQRRKADAEQKRNSALFQPEPFDYSLHHGGQANCVFPAQVRMFVYADKHPSPNLLICNKV